MFSKKLVVACIGIGLGAWLLTPIIQDKIKTKKAQACTESLLAAANIIFDYENKYGNLPNPEKAEALFQENHIKNPLEKGPNSGWALNNWLNLRLGETLPDTLIHSENIPVETILLLPSQEPRYKAFKNGELPPPTQPNQINNKYGVYLTTKGEVKLLTKEKTQPLLNLITKPKLVKAKEKPIPLLEIESENKKIGNITEVHGKIETPLLKQNSPFKFKFEIQGTPNTCLVTIEFYNKYEYLINCDPKSPRIPLSQHYSLQNKIETLENLPYKEIGFNPQASHLFNVTKIIKTEEKSGRKETIIHPIQSGYKVGVKVVKVTNFDKEYTLDITNNWLEKEITIENPPPGTEYLKIRINGNDIQLKNLKIENLL
jgi:hypothetical protein